MITRFAEEVDMMARHLQILETVLANEPIGIVGIAQEVGYQEHEVRYSLRALEKADLVEPSHDGAVTTAHIPDFMTDFNDALTTVTARVESLKADTAEIRP